MTCCSSGKARVYFNIPTKGGLKYKLKNSTKWTTLLADEPLTHSCSQATEKDAQYSVTCGIDGFDCNPFCVGPISWIGNNAIQTGNGIFYFQGRIVGRNCDGNLTIVRQSPGKDSKIFTVTGTETGTKYLEIEVDECPDVQTIPCKFDPAKEQFIDIEMSASPNIISCIDIMEAGPNPVTGALGIHIILRKTVIDPEGQYRPPATQSRGYHYSPKGCPAPKARVECCPKGICGEDKKCPKGTTCELICNGFKCCYIKGKLVRSIKL